MFWRGQEREPNKEQNGGRPYGQVRVLVVGDSGVGKSSLVQLIVKGSSMPRPTQTVGCKVDVKHVTYKTFGSSSSSGSSDTNRDFFVELWDISGHERYKDCRSLFYSQINGIIFVHDLSQRKTKSSLQKWAAEVALNGTFSAPLMSGGPCGLPVPFIVIGNKVDIEPKDGSRGSSSNLVDAARQWVEKQGLLSSSEDLPLTETFPGTAGLVAAAKEARFDKEAVMKFFRLLFKRRYFPEELPTPTPWSTPPVERPISRSSDNLSDDIFHIDSSSSHQYKYNQNVLPPLPAQRNLTPPPTLYPQQPVTFSESYSYPRFGSSTSLSHGAYNNSRTKRTDINV